MKLFIALAVLIFISMPKVNATPSHINNSTQATQTKVQEVVATEVVQPTITSEAPTPAPLPVVETEKLPPSSEPKDIAQATLVDLGVGDAWYAVEYIGFKESSWNPRAINSIGACGLFQALPCEKMNCSLSDVACQVRWATNYATTRYGSWHQAYTFWTANNWW
ncbi:MAG: hypothetical protein WCJ60_02210 [bacterium]